jgi:uracil permease
MANLIYDIKDKPKFGKMIIFALQQLLAILAATIAVPTIIGIPTQIPAAIFGAGVGTLVYQAFTKFKSPVFLGSSFAFLSSLGVAIAYGYCGILLGSIVAGLVYVVIAVIIHFVGTKWISKLMPPIIIGPTVTLIGLSLAGAAMGDIVKANGTLLVKTLEDGTTTVSLYGNYNLVALLCGLVTFFTVVICSTQKKYTMPKLIPFIIGIGAGYLVASIFTVIGMVADIDYLRIVNWQPVINNFVNEEGAFKGISAFFSVPKFSLVEAIKELVTGNIAPEILGATENKATVITLGGIAEVVIAFLPVALVVFAEHIADHKNLSSIIDKDLIEEPGLKRTLLGDGVGSIAGTAFGVCPNTTYGESVGCVAITKNASVVTITTTTIMCTLLSFFSPITTALQTIPSCVMGGVCLTLYGFIAISGLKMFKEVDLGNNKNLFVVASILISGIGGLTIQIPYALDGDGSIAKTIQITAIATALILGIITNAILTKVENSKLGKETEKANEQSTEQEANQE